MRRSSLLPSLTRLAAVTALTAGSLAVAGGAVAETGGYDDVHGDMAGHGADIYDVQVVNGKRVRVRITHDDLVRSYKSGASARVFIDTDKDRHGPEFVFLAGLFEGTDYSLSRAEHWKPTGEALTCSYSMKLDYADDVTTIWMDRDCLDKPGKVRVGVRTGGVLDDGTVVRDWLKVKRAFTPWVKRG